MKNIISKIIILITIICAVFTLSACTGGDNAALSDTGEYSILCSTFPQYDWVRNIIGDTSDINVSLLISNGTESHSFQPSANDIMKISGCDIFIYNGGASEAAFDEIVEKNNNPSQKSINMMAVLGDELLDEEEHNHSHDDEAKDEHIWLSLQNAEFLCKYITEEIILLNPENEQQYRENSEEYIEKLRTLDSKLRKTVDTSATNEIVVVDRFPFRYLAEDYGLICYSAFPGCSSETDASFNTIISLAQQLDKSGNYKAVVIENSNSSIADAVREATRSKQLETYEMNSLQAVSTSDIEQGLTYLSAMEENCNVIEKILN